SGRNLPLDQVGRPRTGPDREGGPLALAADDARQVHLAHKPGNPVTANLYALTVELPPDLLDVVRAKVVALHATHLQLRVLVAPAARRLGTIDRGVVGGWASCSTLGFKDELKSKEIAESAARQGQRVWLCNGGLLTVAPKGADRKAPGSAKAGIGIGSGIS